MEQTLTLTTDQIYLLLDTMDGYDIVYHSDSDQKSMQMFNDLYDYLRSAYEQSI